MKTPHLTPLTLKALYQAATDDRESHQRRIDAHFRRLDKRRQRIIRRRLAGLSLHAIAAEEGVSHGSIQSAINGALRAIRKAIAGEPRYNVQGRSRTVNEEA